MTYDHAPKPREGGPCPWGLVQELTEWCGGDACFVSTASHGGFWVARHVWRTLPAELRAYARKWSHGWPAGYFEEDEAAQRLVAEWSDLRREVYGYEMSDEQARAHERRQMGIEG